MNRIRSFTIATVVLTVGAGTAVALTSTGSASAGTSAPRAASFTIRAHHGTEADLDLGASGFSAGDQQLFTGSLTRGGDHVGHLVGSCTTARVGKTADQLCEFVLRLGKGQITASGTVSSGSRGPGTFLLPVVGGTGRYTGASGEIAVTATSGPSFPIAVSLR